MSLVADYSSDSDSNSNIKSQSSLNVINSSSKTVKPTKPSKSGPHKIIVGKPKNFEDYSSDEEIKKDSKLFTNSKVSSLTFRKLKFKGNGSSLFDMLPPPKSLVEEPTEELIPGKSINSVEHDFSEAEEISLKSTIPKATPTSFVPFAVKNKTKIQPNLSTSKIKVEKELSKPTSTLEESLFPIGNNIQDSYTNEISLSLPTTNYQTSFKSVATESDLIESGLKQESSDSFYYGYDYSTSHPDSFAHENQSNLPQSSHFENLQPLDRLPEDAERFFGGSKKRNRNQTVNFLDIDLGKEMNSEEALQARALRAHSGAPSTFSSASLDSNAQFKRRHNIVFLAQQARTRENELEERYADNRRTKRETKSKYGF